MKNLDLRGLKCPLPVLKTRKFLKTLAPGEKFSASCTDPLSAIDIPNLLRETGDLLEGQSRDGEVLTFLVRKAVSTPKAMLGLIYRDSEVFDALMGQLATQWAAEGVKIAGLLQRSEGEHSWVTRIDDGRSLDLMQDLGLCAEGCRLDPGKLAEAAGWLAEALAQQPDLLLISRFGRFEAEGGGYLAEIGAAAAQDQPSLIGVSHKFEAAWRDFAGDCAETAEADRDAALNWWRALRG